ncbi:MAG TPA: prepilin peptidase [Thermoanaerobaculia bacterium]|nr:prepilin peptidase [Thermoanaerobaculia bacterium]
MFPLLALYVFLLGAIIGSFLNVVIYRYPHGESLAFPGSHCPNCGAPIRFYDNVPVLSWVLLRGRCRACHQSIAVRYPLVELANGLFYLALFIRTGVSLSFVPLAAIVSMTIVLIFIDLDIQILPDVIDLPGIGLGLLLGYLAQREPPAADLTVAPDLLSSIIGAIVGAGLLWGIAVAYKLLRHIEGMGLGDVKMLAMIGAILGWQSLLPCLLLACITGAIFGILLTIRSTRNLQFALPFGVFLGLSLIFTIFFGGTLSKWYASLLRL